MVWVLSYPELQLSDLKFTLLH